MAKEMAACGSRKLWHRGRGIFGKRSFHAVASSELKTGVRGSCGTFRRAYKLTQDDDGPDMYAKALEGDLEKYKEIAASEVLRIFIRITAIYPMTGLLPPVDLTETKKN